jgi:hypothetical protein
LAQAAHPTGACRIICLGRACPVAGFSFSASTMLPHRPPPRRPDRDKNGSRPSKINTSQVYNECAGAFMAMNVMGLTSMQSPGSRRLCSLSKNGAHGRFVLIRGKKSKPGGIFAVVCDGYRHRLNKFKRTMQRKKRCSSQRALRQRHGRRFCRPTGIRQGENSQFLAGEHFGIHTSPFERIGASAG